MPVNISSNKQGMKQKFALGALATLGGLGIIGAIKLSQQPIVHADTTTTEAPVTSQSSNVGDTTPAMTNSQPQQQLSDSTPNAYASSGINTSTNGTTSTNTYIPIENQPIQSSNNSLFNNSISYSNENNAVNTEDNKTNVTQSNNSDNQYTNSNFSITSTSNDVPSNVPSSYTSIPSYKLQSSNGIKSYFNRDFQTIHSSNDSQSVSFTTSSYKTSFLHHSINKDSINKNSNLSSGNTLYTRVNTNNVPNRIPTSYKELLQAIYPRILASPTLLAKAPIKPKTNLTMTTARVVPLNINGQLNINHRPKMVLLGASASGLPSKAFITDVSDYTEGTDSADAGGGPYPQIDLSTWKSPAGTIAFCNNYSLDGPHGGREYTARVGTAPRAMKQGLAYAIDSANKDMHGINKSNLRLVEELIIWETETANPRQRVHADHVHGAARTDAFLAQKAINANYPYFGDVAPSVKFIKTPSKNSHFLYYRLELKNGTNVHNAHIYLHGAPKGTELKVHGQIEPSGSPIDFYPDNIHNKRDGYHAAVALYNPNDNLDTDTGVDSVKLTATGATDGKIQVQDYKTSGGGHNWQDITLMKVTPHPFKVTAGAKGGGTPVTVPVSTPGVTTPETTPAKTTPIIIHHTTNNNNNNTTTPTANNNNNNSSSSGGCASSSTGGNSSSSTGGSPSGNGNQQQGGNGNGTQGGGNGTQSTGNGNNGGGNGSPANNPNNSNNPNNGQPNNSNPNNDDPNNVIVPSDSGDSGSSSNNNNIVPSGAVINNNDYVLPNNLNDHSDYSAIIAALVNNEDRDNQDALNRLDNNIQNEEAQEIQSAKSNAITSANILSAAERGKDAAQIEAMNASASVQSIEDSMNIDSSLASLSNQAKNVQSSYSDSLSSLEAESNKLVADTLARLRSKAMLPVPVHRQAYMKIQQAENQFMQELLNDNAANNGALTTLEAELQQIQSEAYATKQPKSNIASKSNAYANTSAKIAPSKQTISTSSTMPLVSSVYPQNTYYNFANAILQPNIGHTMMPLSIYDRFVTNENNDKIGFMKHKSRRDKDFENINDSDDAFYSEQDKDSDKALSTASNVKRNRNVLNMREMQSQQNHITINSNNKLNSNESRSLYNNENLDNKEHHSSTNNSIQLNIGNDMHSLYYTDLGTHPVISADYINQHKLDSNHGFDSHMINTNSQKNLSNDDTINHNSRSHSLPRTGDSRITAIGLFWAILGTLGIAGVDVSKHRKHRLD